MAITFTNDRSFSTDVGSKIFQNVPLASQWFKIKVTSKSVMPAQTLFLSKIFFDFWHTFMGLGTDTTIPLRFTVTNSAGAFAQTNVSLSLGVTYVIAITWDGVGGHQVFYLNGIPTQFGTFTGNTQNNSSAMTIGVSDGTVRVVYTLDDHNVWDNYLLTQADITYLLNGGDPTTVGTSATWRGRWTMTGTPGANAVIGDPGLKNAYGGGSRLPGGDGSDCIASAGAGTAVYAPALVWTPTVTATPYVATSGQVITVKFISLIDGTPQTPLNVISVPTMTVNGTPLGALGLGPNGWFPGGMPFLFFTTPGNYQVQPGDVVKLTAPSAWANTGGGSVAALDGAAPILNNTGRSSFGTDILVKTLAIGTNNPQSPMSSNREFYFPFKDHHRKWGQPGNRGKITANYGNTIFNQPIANGIDNTTYPGPVGKVLAMWDDNDPTHPNVGVWSTGLPSITSVTGNTSGAGTLTGGKLIGSWTYADFEHVSLIGNVTMDITFSFSGSGGPPNYDNLVFVFPGDWALVDGVPVYDRSDPWALSARYLDRVPQNVGSLRWVDSGPVGPDPRWASRARYLARLTDENWGDTASTTFTTAFSTFGPVNTTTTPWLYSEHFGKPGNLGTTYAATLASTISTTPAVGTLETWTFSDGATAPLLAGLEVLIDSEVVNLDHMGADATQWVVYRGANGTTPATHSPGTVTVYGRLPITAALNADGTSTGSDLVGFTTATPHGLTSFEVMQSINGAPNVTLTNGDVVKFTGAAMFITGPTTGFAIQASSVVGGHPTTGVPTGVVSGGSSNFVNLFPMGDAIPHEAQAIVTARFPNADYHLNLHQSCCDEYIWSLARRLLPLVATGRNVYIEYSNEIWNQGFGIFGWLKGYMGNYVYRSTDQLGYGLKRAVEAAAIFKSVWGSRAAEIKTVVNCQMGGDDVLPHLTLAIANGWQIDRIMQAPYMDMTPSVYNAGIVNLLNDAQAIDMFLHDLFYVSNGVAAQLALTRSRIAAYNTAMGNSVCKMIGYEGGVSIPIPLPAGPHNDPSNPTHWEQRIHDIITHPNWYLAELDTYAFLQSQGFDRIHIYAMPGMFWEPHAWGGYHSVVQDHGRGDGSDGKLNNLLCRANPASAQYKGVTVNQDLNTVSVRGQAFIDWLAAVAAPPSVTRNVLVSRNKRAMIRSFTRT